MFEYLEAAGAEKEQMASALALQDLADRLASCEDRRKLGLRETLCLDDLGNADEPLRYMVITETGTTGMYGAWQTGESRMYLALATLGYPKLEGGGSFGYGKAGLIRGSATHTVVAYSCFRPKPNDGHVTRRLLGMTYWGEHHVGEAAYPGFARFGNETIDEVFPFEDDKADQMAADLGLKLRDPASGQDFGTTFLIVEPTVQPDDLLHAIERNWWPALEDQSIQFDVSVVSDGEPQRPRPKKQEELKPFVEAYELARMPQDNKHPSKRRVKFEKVEGYPNPGTLGLVADPSGWSYPNRKAGSADDEVEHRSLVALMRKPRMVVEYLEAGQAQPFVRGVFIADDSTDQILRQTEPKAHDAWQTKPDEDTEPQAAEVAKTVLGRITRNVRRFRESLKPAKPSAEQLELPEWNRLMRLFQRLGTKPVVPEPDAREVTIEPRSRIEQAEGDQVRATGHARVGLSERHEGESAEVEVRIQYRMVEDDRIGDPVKLAIRAPKGFAQMQGTDRYRGVLHRDSAVRFRYESEPYDALWTCRLIVDADVVGSGGTP